MISKLCTWVNGLTSVLILISSFWHKYILNTAAELDVYMAKCHSYMS